MTLSVPQFLSIRVFEVAAWVEQGIMDRGCMGKSSFVMEGGATKEGVSTGRGMDDDECMDSFPCGTQQIQKICI